MKTTDTLVISPPDSPYKILGADYDADARAIQRAFRRFFIKNRKDGIRFGKNAQKTLTDAKERVKADALCCRVPMPRVSLKNLKPHMKEEKDDLGMLSEAIKHPEMLSDLSFPAQIESDLHVALDVGDIVYRSKDERGQ